MYRDEVYNGYTLRIWTTKKVEIMLGELVVANTRGVENAKTMVDNSLV